MVTVIYEQIPTWDLLKGPKTQFWVGISGKAEERISPRGANSLGIADSLLKGKKIGEIESMLKNEWRMVRVGLVKIWFEKIQSD